MPDTSPTKPIVNIVWTPAKLRALDRLRTMLDDFVNGENDAKECQAAAALAGAPEEQGGNMGRAV